MTHFEVAGKINTKDTVCIAINTAYERGINYIVVASNEGDTAKLFIGSKKNIICITHVNGYKIPGQNEMSIETREELQKNGIIVHTASHLFSGVGVGLSRKFGGIYPGDIMGNTLKIFGKGMKVCVEIAIMALDAGLIPLNEDIITVGGSGRGADTAIIIRPSHAHNILSTEIPEILCKPKHFI